MQNEAIEKIIQFIKFGIIGFSNNIIFYIVNVAVLFALKSFEVFWDFVAGNTAGFLISVLWSFYWNNKYVFKKKENEERSTAKALLKTYVSYGCSGIILNNLLGWLWISAFGISKYIAPVISLFLTVPINFMLNKLWAFKTNKRRSVIHPLSDVKSTNIGENTNIWQFCVIFPKAKIGSNCNICANVLIENDVTVGNNVTVKSGVQLWDGVTLEDNVFIGPNVTFTNDLFPRSKVYPEKFAKTVIKKGASIGANTTIVAGNTIGENAMVGAGSVVTHDIPDNEVWFGNPARFVRKP